MKTKDILIGEHYAYGVQQDERYGGRTRVRVVAVGREYLPTSRHPSNFSNGVLVAKIRDDGTEDKSARFLVVNPAHIRCRWSVYWERETRRRQERKERSLQHADIQKRKMLALTTLAEHGLKMKADSFPMWVKIPLETLETLVRVYQERTA